MSLPQEKLPECWTVREFGDLVEYVQRGKSPRYAERSSLPVINQKCVRWWGVDTDHVKYVHDDQIPSWDEFRYLKPSDLLWNSTGTGTIGRACLYRGELEEAVVDSHVTIVRANKSALEPRYAFYFVMSPLVQGDIEEMQAGSTNQVELSKKAIVEKRVPLAPLNEQRRIVDKIETLFAQLDKGKEAVREVQKLLTRYRQSVLKAAVTGELTADWRAERKGQLEHGSDLLDRILDAREELWDGRGKYKRPAPLSTDGLPELPEGWEWATVDQLANVIGGLTKNSKRKEMPHRRPMLRVANVYQNRFELDDLHETGVTNKELARVLLEPRDLLVVEGNGSKDQIGRMAVWNGEIPNAVHQNHLIKVRLFEPALAEYLTTWFQSSMGRQIVEKVASSTSGLYTLSISKVKALVVPLPSLAEIAQIMVQVDAVFGKIEALKVKCETELKRSSSLRQSILKDAFAGRLVAQDPTDEPASELLARIAAEKTPPKKARRKVSA